ncbi:hypothetical protein ACUN24_15140 [Pedobacter sp. WC2501]|uniref:hypothetical protein n=1 Tax=Pedobacter sp. WC2501 TaxID=3461400 RepID=UPI0040462E6D
MGSKINKLFLLLYLCIFAVGCGERHFDELEGPDISYQICPGKTDILCIRRTIDKGAPLIQLFDNRGNLLESYVLASMAGFQVTAMGNNSIQITYFVGQSDLEMFLPWFKKNKFNPNHIGKYAINYNYEIHNEYSESEGSGIDSLNVDKMAQTTSLFLKGKLIATRPTYLLILKSSELLAYEPKDKVYTPYLLGNNDLAKDYLNKILANYDKK